MDLLINFMNVTGFDCGGADVLRILKFVFTLIDVVLFIVPIGLIVIVMVDFAKNVIAGKEDEMKKNLGTAIKRILYCVVIFFVDDFSYFVVGLVGSAGVEAADKAYSCIDIAKTHDLSQYEMNYVDMKPKKDLGDSCEHDEECLSENCGKNSKTCIGSDEEKDSLGACYLCTDKTGSGKKYFMWSKSSLENNLSTLTSCIVYDSESDEISCKEKNNDLEFCYYCDTTKTYYYGNKPNDTCSSDGGWKIDSNKDKQHCSSDYIDEELKNDEKEYCYVCSVGATTNYMWGKKPDEVCMAANGWQINYNLSSKTLCTGVALNQP